MVQDPNTEYGKRIWAGDPKTVAEARTKFHDDPEGQLIPFAVALYSFRTNEKFAKELLALRSQLIAYAKDYMLIPLGDSDTYRERADKADVLSTYFEWMSRRKDISRSERKELHDMAVAVYGHGIHFASSYQEQFEQNHTWCLLELTAARLLLNEGKYRSTWSHLGDVRRHMHRINDTNQRTRVYRKLGMLYRKSFRLLLGFYWGIRACFVPGVPKMVRIKSAAALLGIDR